MHALTSLRASVLAVVAVAAAAAPAQADTVVFTDPTAANVSDYGATAAWSRRALDGRFHLIVRDGDVIGAAPVPQSTAIFDPDVGPTSSGGRLIVYSRCLPGCDIYAYDPAKRLETKVKAVSSKGVNETAPSFFKGRIAFSRDGKQRGLYLYRPGRGVKRISTKPGAETDLGETRVASLYLPGASAADSFVRLTNYTGKDQRTVGRASIGGAGEGSRLVSPTLSRFNVHWLETIPLSEKTRVHRTGLNAHRGLEVLTADRDLPGIVLSLAAWKVPTLYTGGRGDVLALDPPLRFAT